MKKTKEQIMSSEQFDRVFFFFVSAIVLLNHDIVNHSGPRYHGLNPYAPKIESFFTLESRPFAQYLNLSNRLTFLPVQPILFYKCAALLLSGKNEKKEKKIFCLNSVGCCIIDIRLRFVLSEVLNTILFFFNKDMCEKLLFS